MRARDLTVAVMLVLLVSGCADDGPSVADAPTGPGTDAQDGAEPPRDGLLDEIPGDCSLLAEADDALEARIVATIDPAVDHGPLVIVEEEGERVAATTTYTSPGVEGDAAVWHLEDGEPVAISEEAARISSVEIRLRDSAGSDAVARARALATDCSWVAAVRSSEDPPPPEPRIDEALMFAEPDTTQPGDLVALHFPQRTDRGVAFELQRRDGEAWTTTHWMTSDADNGGDPVTVPEGTEGFGWPDIGIGGPGPDHVQLPDDLEPGEYRICTESAVRAMCTPLDIVD